MTKAGHIGGEERRRNRDIVHHARQRELFANGNSLNTSPELSGRVGRDLPEMWVAPTRPEGYAVTLGRVAPLPPVSRYQSILTSPCFILIVKNRTQPHPEICFITGHKVEQCINSNYFLPRNA